MLAAEFGCHVRDQCVAVPEGDRCAFSKECRCAGATDSRCSTGHDGDMSIQVEIHGRLCGLEQGVPSGWAAAESDVRATDGGLMVTDCPAAASIWRQPGNVSQRHFRHDHFPRNNPKSLSSRIVPTDKKHNVSSFDRFHAGVAGSGPSQRGGPANRET
jgi:hypothetical protein